MSKFGEWWRRLIARFWPHEESAPGDWWLLKFATLPAAAVTLALRLAGLGLGWRALAILVAALVWRASPWFRRPESVHINVLGGLTLAEIAGLVIWHHP